MNPNDAPVPPKGFEIFVPKHENDAPPDGCLWASDSLGYSDWEPYPPVFPDFSKCGDGLIFARPIPQQPDAKGVAPDNCPACGVYVRTGRLHRSGCSMARPLRDQEPIPPGEFVATIEAARSAPGSDIRFAAPADASETATPRTDRLWQMHWDGLDELNAALLERRTLSETLERELQQAQQERDAAVAQAERIGVSGIHNRVSLQKRDLELEALRQERDTLKAALDEARGSGEKVKQIVQSRLLSILKFREEQLIPAAPVPTCVPALSWSDYHELADERDAAQAAQRMAEAERDELRSRLESSLSFFNPIAESFGYIPSKENGVVIPGLWHKKGEGFWSTKQLAEQIADLQQALAGAEGIEGALVKVIETFRANIQINPEPENSEYRETLQEAIDDIAEAVGKTLGGNSPISDFHEWLANAALANPQPGGQG